MPAPASCTVLVTPRRVGRLQRANGLIATPGHAAVYRRCAEKDASRCAPAGGTGRRLGVHGLGSLEGGLTAGAPVVVDRHRRTLCLMSTLVVEQVSWREASRRPSRAPFRSTPAVGLRRRDAELRGGHIRTGALLVIEQGRAQAPGLHLPNPAADDPRPSGSAGDFGTSPPSSCR